MVHVEELRGGGIEQHNMSKDVAEMEGDLILRRCVNLRLGRKWKSCWYPGIGLLLDPNWEISRSFLAWKKGKELQVCRSIVGAFDIYR